MTAPTPTPTTAAAPGARIEEIECPWTKTKVNVSIPPAYSAEEFCPTCSFPLFWHWGVIDMTAEHNAAKDAKAVTDDIARRASLKLALAKQAQLEKQLELAKAQAKPTAEVKPGPPMAIDVPSATTNWTDTWVDKNSPWYWPAMLASALLVLLIAVLIVMVVSMAI